MPAPDSTGDRPRQADQRHLRARRALAIILTLSSLVASCGQPTVELLSSPALKTQASVGNQSVPEPSAPASREAERPTEVVIARDQESATEVVIASETNPATEPAIETSPTTRPQPRPTIGSEISSTTKPQPKPKPTIGSEILAVEAPVGPRIDVNSFEIVDGPSQRNSGEPDDGVSGPFDLPLGDERGTALDEGPLVARPGTVVVHAIDSELVAYALPDEGADVVSIFNNPTAQGGPLVLRATGLPVNDWIEVLLPIRPNGTIGWVKIDSVELTQNPYRIDLDVNEHELTIFRDKTEVLRTKVSIGTGATPTPIGDFYLIELLEAPDPTGIYGPYAYGLSGFSESLSSFNGGEGVIGIHGTNQPQLLGTDVSHGCVRVDNEIITVMSAFLPLGTPVSIH